MPVLRIRSASSLAAAAALSCALGAPAFAQVGGVPHDASGFTEYVASLLRQQLGGETVAVREPLVLGIAAQRTKLDKLYAGCESNRGNCADDVNVFVKTTAEQFRASTIPATRESLRLAVRTAASVQQAQRDNRGDATTYRPRPFVGPLVTVPVFDTTRATRLISEKDYKTLNLSVDQAREEARKNTYNALPQVLQTAKPAPSGEVGRIDGTVPQPSRLIFIDDWKPLADAQHGVLIVAAPDNGTVLYIGEDSPTAIDALRAQVREVMGKSPNPLSDVLLRWSSSGWQVVP
ncbi:hypothetical protein [Roseateles chitosanitabidus]|jgi:hypothetical protein|uniref:hypothetical protein n=1 Tax=Roseateles chitosanitabidus TaxID=65048 RepID=UPI000833CFF7|nr:hypothetical protein [Roseateles chitosanitabidus]MBO9686636.1 hypothetical protein [Roseateles chitosanitabidus]